MLSEGRTAQVDEAHDPQCLSPGDLADLQPIARIGVTGHRDLADPERAAAATADALGRILAALETAKWPTGKMYRIANSATKAGYRIVSPLAEGADRVVAALVLSSDPRLAERTRELVVPVPFGLGHYRGHDGQPGTDCRTPQSQAEFDRLSSAAQWVRPLHPGVPGGPAQQEEWYRDVGTYVLEHCDFLFALWDGQDNGREGGTADIVKLALKYGTPVIWIPVTRKEATGPATLLPHDEESQLLTSLAADGRPAMGPALHSLQAAAILNGQETSHTTVGLLLERFGRTAELCRYAKTDGHVLQSITKEKSDPGTAPPDGAAAVQSVADWIIPDYVIADGLAKHYQLVLKVLNTSVYAGATAAVILGAFAAILFPYRGNWRLPVVFEAIVLVALFLVQVLDIRRKCRDQWVAFRAMSEYFRIGRFLALVTPAKAPGLEFDHFARLHSLASRRVSVPWFNPVLERAWERRPKVDLGDSDVPWLKTYLITQWVDRQIRYAQASAKVHLTWERILQWAIRVILLATVLIVISHVILDYLPQQARTHETSRDLVASSVAFFAIALTSLAAAFNGYSGQQRHSYHAVRFERMAEELERIRESMASTKTLKELRTQLDAAGRTMLGEATEWYMEMEQQVIDSPS